MGKVGYEKAFTGTNVVGRKRRTHTLGEGLSGEKAVYSPVFNVGNKQAASLSVDMDTCCRLKRLILDEGSYRAVVRDLKYRSFG